jgi:hypothetical protein
VICSPRAFQSRWVNDEIKIFCDLGRSDRILTLLVEGEPRESFPPALLKATETADGSRNLEPLAADVSNRGARRAVRRTALLRLIAPLLGCDYDDLQRRFRTGPIAAGFDPGAANHLDEPFNFPHSVCCRKAQMMWSRRFLAEVMERLRGTRCIFK